MDEYEEYRQQQEDFVSNLKGTTSFDVILSIFPNACSVLLTSTTLLLIGSNINKQIRTIIEFSLIVIPCILCCTILSDKVVQISQGMLIISAANILTILTWKIHDVKLKSTLANIRKLPFITNFRALINIITVVCILAVDFTCFPRKLAKTETYGFSLMDSGVGLFMIANALVAPEARKLYLASTISPVKKFIKNIQECFPLLILGTGRYVAIEILGYQRHVSEYGVHWNFFLTLVSIKIFIGILPKKLTYKYPLLVGIWILCMHEYSLTTKGLKEWVLSNEPRNDLISANREGLVSIPGYIALYLIGISIGQIIHYVKQNSVQDLQEQIHKRISIFGIGFNISFTLSMLILWKLIIINTVLSLVTYYCHKYFNVSRRLANTGYCVWILSLSTFCLTLLIFTDIILEILRVYIKEKSSKKLLKNFKMNDNLKNEKNVNFDINTIEVFDAINNNGLLFFIFANLLTGFINMTIKTLTVDEPRTVGIIIMYMLTNTVFILLRYRRNLLIKFKE